MTYGIVIDRSMIANIIDTTPAESYALMAHGKSVINAGIQRRACCADCLLDKNQTCHLASAQCSFPWSQYSGFCTTDFAGRRTVYKDYASLFRNNKELVKSLSPSQAQLLPAGHGTPISDWQIYRWCELVKTPTATR